MLRRLSLSLIICAALAGCGGGGASGPAPVPQSPTNTSPGLQNVAVSITIPSASSTAAAAGRRPLYVSKNTQSASIFVNNAPQPAIVNLAAGSPNCAPVAGDNRACTINVSAPVGTVAFTVSLYASTDGTGAVLSKNSVSQTIVAGKANAFNMSLDGVVASIALALANPNPPTGSPTTTKLSVNFLDASGAAIIGSDPFVNPIALTDSDTSGVTVLSLASLKTPADAAALTVTYSGAALAQAIFGATASGVAAGSVIPATLTPQAPTVSPSALVDWPTYAYDSQRSGFNPYTTGITPAAISGVHVAWQKNIGGGTQSQPLIATNVAGHQALVILGQYVTAQAYDALSGDFVWSTTLPKQDVQACGTAGISGTPVYVKSLNALFMAAGNGGGTPNHVVLYRLDAGTGKITNQVDVTPNLLAGEANTSHAGVTYANGRIYVGTGSNCEGSTNTNYPSWRGRVVSVDPSNMSVLSTFFTTWNQGGNYGGGGIWSWGGVSADPNGNVFVATGNAETTDAVSSPITAPFTAAPNEQGGYAEHLVKLSGDLSQVEGSNYPGFNFAVGGGDLDYIGTPIITQPSVSAGCGALTATQGKGGTVVINNTQTVGQVSSFNLSVPSGIAYYMGNPAYSPNTSFIYAPITTSGPGSSMLPPGLAAIGGCGTSIAWHAQFGPDSSQYPGDKPRSAPIVTAGNVVLIASPCTPNGNAGCGAPGVAQGAVWAVNAQTGEVLGGGKPILITGDSIRMAPSADGLWMWVIDSSGNLYALSVDPTVKAITPHAVRRIVDHNRVQGKEF